jgi:5-methylcytosine-specific restriction protein A
MSRLQMLKPQVAALLQPRMGPVETPRIRGRALQAIRARVLSANPLCVECEAKGIVAEATEVDHIVALGLGGTDHPHDDTNRQGLCDDCHAAKSKADMALMR